MHNWLVGGLLIAVGTKRLTSLIKSGCDKTLQTKGLGAFDHPRRPIHDFHSNAAFAYITDAHGDTPVHGKPDAPVHGKFQSTLDGLTSLQFFI